VLNQFYQVSSLGRVKSLKFSKERVLNPYKDNGGYFSVQLWNNKKLKKLYVHRLVADSFLGKNSLFVNHKNSNKSDNRIENLEFVSSRENNTHKYINKNKKSKFTGVHWHKNNNKWISQITINNKQKHLGCFENELDAHKAYLKALEENGLNNKYAS
jgi:hypothetical protein